MNSESVTLETPHGEGGGNSPSTPGPEASALDMRAKIAAQIAAADEAQVPPADPNPQTPEAAGQESPPASQEEPSSPPPNPNEDPPNEEDRENGKWPSSAVDRVRKLKEQRASLREEVEQLKAELAKRNNEAPAPLDPAETQRTKPEQLASAEPLGHLNHPREIEAEVTRAEETHELAKDLLDDLLDRPETVEARLRQFGVAMPNDDWSVTAMRDRLRQIRDNTERVMKAGPKRIAWLQQQDASIQEAARVMPGLLDPKSQDFQDVKAVLRDFPGLRQLPNWPYEAAVHAAGRRAIAAQSSSAAPTRRAVPPPTRLASQPSPAPRQQPADELTLAAANLRRNGAGRDAMMQYARAAVLRTEA